MVRYYNGETGKCMGSSSTIRLVWLNDDSSPSDSSEDESHGTVNENLSSSKLLDFSISGYIYFLLYVRYSIVI